MRIPPGLGKADLTDAVHRLEQVVGQPWAFTDEEDVALYRDAYFLFRDAAELDARGPYLTKDAPADAAP